MYAIPRTWQIDLPIENPLKDKPNMLFPTTIAGSLPKPEWLAEPNILWAPWKSTGAELARAKRDATMLAIKLQEDAGVDIVTEGEQARQHFVHGFLEKIEGIDFAHKVEMGIRKDRYKAMVPQVVAPLQLKGRVHADEARIARTHTTSRLKFTLPGPMTIIDTIADKYYSDRVKMAFASAPTIAHLLVDRLKDIKPHGAKASALRTYLKTKFGISTHPKTAGMSLYRLSQELPPKVHRKGHMWFFGPPEGEQPKNSGGQTPEQFDDLL